MEVKDCYVYSANVLPVKVVLSDRCKVGHKIRLLVHLLDTNAIPSTHPRTLIA